MRGTSLALGEKVHFFCCRQRHTDQYTYTKYIQAETKANLDCSADCCAVQVLREGSLFVGERGDRILGRLIQSLAIQLNPNKSCAIACCHDNRGLSEKDGSRVAVFHQSGML